MFIKNGPVSWVYLRIKWMYFSSDDISYLTQNVFVGFQKVVPIFNFFNVLMFTQSLLHVAPNLVRCNYFVKLATISFDKLVILYVGIKFKASNFGQNFNSSFWIASDKSTTKEPKQNYSKVEFYCE